MSAEKHWFEREALIERYCELFGCCFVIVEAMSSSSTLNK